MNDTPRVALITGAARRIGAAIARRLHADGYNVVIHYYRSADAAALLVDELNAQRAASACCFAADLGDMAALDALAAFATGQWQRLDLLVNNASTFYPTPLPELTEADWQTLMDSNLKAPVFLARACLSALRESRGSIINITDIHARQGLANHVAYVAAKAGLEGATRSLARELAPMVRVNGVAPGAILWPEHEPEHELDERIKQRIIAAVPLQRLGEPGDIAAAVAFLASNDYFTGEILAVAGGKQLD